MKTWITSDIHFYHANILKFCHATRPYYDVEEMNQKIVESWNSMIDQYDTVYILGDVAFANAYDASKIVNRCNGNKILVKGNHDTKLLQEPLFTNCFESIHDYLEVGYNGHRLVLFHFPIWEWDRMYHGAVHFHGHCHARPTGIPGRILDVSMDGNACLPYSMDEAIAIASKNAIRTR